MDNIIAANPLVAIGREMGLFRFCKCGHMEEEHAMDAPEGEQECMEEGCDCPNFELEEPIL